MRHSLERRCIHPCLLLRYAPNAAPLPSNASYRPTVRETAGATLSRTPGNLNPMSLEELNYICKPP